MPSNAPFPHNHPIGQIGGHMMSGGQPMDRIDRMEQG